MNKTISNAPILTTLSVATACLQGVVGSLARQALLTGKATLSLREVAMLAEGTGVIDASVREALGVEVERLDLADRQQVNPTPSPQTVQEFLNERRANQERVVRAYAEPRDEAGFAELKNIAEQPAVETPQTHGGFHPIGAIALPLNATPEHIQAAVGELLASFLKGGNRPNVH